MRTVLVALFLLASVAVLSCSTRPRANVGARRDEPLPDRAYKAELSLVDQVTQMKPGEKQTVKVKVKNASDTRWIAYGSGEGIKYRVAVGDSWLDTNGKLITNMDGRYGLPSDLLPGREVEVPLMITAPATPGEYMLQLDMVQEGITWFQDKGSPVFKASVKVQ